MNNRLANFFEIVSVLAIASVLVGLLGRWQVLCDLASHFRIQATVALFVAFVALACLKRKRSAIMVGVAAIILAATLWPFLNPARDTGDATTGRSYRLLTLNVLTNNPRRDRVIDFIRQTDPDFIALQETSAAWMESLDAALRDEWPYRKEQPRSDNFGIALFSKIPWSACAVVEYSDRLPTPSIKATFDLEDGATLNLIVAHPLPPMNYPCWMARNDVFVALANDIRQSHPARTILAGDLNCTP